MIKLTPEFWREARKQIPQYGEELDLERRDSILRSMEVFTDSVNQSGFLDWLVKNRLEPGSELSAGRFCLSEPTSSTAHRFDDAGWWLEGSHSWALGYETNESSPLWFAVVGLRSLNSVATRTYGYITTEQLLWPHLTIVQLQGPTNKESAPTYRNTAKYERALEILKQFRWEFSSIDIVRSWAISNNLPTIYCQPSAQNTYLMGGKCNYVLRYDVTAKRYGFEKMRNHLWRLPIR